MFLGRARKFFLAQSRGAIAPLAPPVDPPLMCRWQKRLFLTFVPAVHALQRGVYSRAKLRVWVLQRLCPPKLDVCRIRVHQGGSQVTRLITYSLDRVKKQNFLPGSNSELSALRMFDGTWYVCE